MELVASTEKKAGLNATNQKVQIHNGILLNIIRPLILENVLAS
jgi:hypothetical protein